MPPLAPPLDPYAEDAPMRRLATVTLCLSSVAAVAAIVQPVIARPAAAFEVQSGGVPLSAAAVSMLASRIGNVPPAAAGPGGAFPPWMGGGRTNAGTMGALPMGGGMPPAVRPAGTVGTDRAALNEQLFGIKR
ncbi:hypothetical protein [Azospirillum sp. B506]|uniref:hypothetical protein n=1 Tax=Azospirillum sp. B506 TaxID=137721 RepID=UPI0005B2A6D2|nr:hypothetical protein [Azospirillum sp. B506]